MNVSRRQKSRFKQNLQSWALDEEGLTQTKQLTMLSIFGCASVHNDDLQNNDETIAFPLNVRLFIPTKGFPSLVFSLNVVLVWLDWFSYKRFVKLLLFMC